MIIAIIPPFDIVMDPESDPEAPASLSPLPAVDPASPAAGPLPGCWGVAVASAANNEETELADMAEICSGVKETEEDATAEGDDVTAADGEAVIEESCAIAVPKKDQKLSTRPNCRSTLIMNDPLDSFSW